MNIELSKAEVDLLLSALSALRVSTYGESDIWAKRLRRDALDLTRKIRTTLPPEEG